MQAYKQLPPAERYELEIKKKPVCGGCGAGGDLV